MPLSELWIEPQGFMWDSLHKGVSYANWPDDYGKSEMTE